MKPLFVFCFWLLTTAVFSQSGIFYTRTIDFSRPENSRWEHPPHENLGTMLLDAHLKGQLKAYTFDVAHDVLKYAPIPQDQLAGPWDPNFDYFADDMVSFKGLMYIARTDIARGNAPGGIAAWEDTQIRGPVVSWRHHFPAAADSTTKSYLLSHLVEQDPEGYDPWMEDFEYFSADRVEYKGKMYLAQRDGLKGVVPDTSNDWKPLPSHVTFFQSNDLTVVKILYHNQTPQMISIRVIDPLKEIHRDVGLNFFYKDVIKFLESSNQPALYLSDIGHVGNGVFLFDDKAKVNFTRWIQSKIISKDIKVDKKAVLHEGEYDLFLKTKPEDINHTNWYPIQNPATKDFTIIAGKLTPDYDYYTIPILSIPAKSLKTLPSPTKPKFYKEIFTDTFLASWIDTVAMDSIDAFPAIAQTPDAFKQNYFDEIHFDYTEAYPVLPALWELILKNNTRFLPGQSSFPCQRNWNGTKVTFTMGEMIADDKLSISQIIPPPNDLPKPEWKIKEVGVVYRIHLNPATEQFRPVQLVISFEEEPHADLIDYRVDWQDVLKVTSGKKEFGAFIDGVKKATLNLRQTAIAYNLIMTR